MDHVTSFSFSRYFTSCVFLDVLLLGVSMFDICGVRVCFCVRRVGACFEYLIISPSHVHNHLVSIQTNSSASMKVRTVPFLISPARQQLHSRRTPTTFGHLSTSTTTLDYHQHHHHGLFPQQTFQGPAPIPKPDQHCFQSWGRLRLEKPSQEHHIDHILMGRQRQR